MSNSILSKSSTGTYPDDEDPREVEVPSSSKKKKRTPRTIKCSNCGEQIPIGKHPDRSGFVIAYHNCMTGKRVPVYIGSLANYNKLKEVK